ncbi:hypothetical protein [Nitrosopumilus ureiphilus]|uniref:YtkA-like domain-containing protein n=1 Tax=Nitrosopumilus ureiphilus TaxID=1470067 RepID=A0A7D5R6Y0_9ARCH|nr:hypothetical protein [Nitrosopumilus ureiphilus]QLH06339.1 hypothetical protein C5F50_04050 [Nitrosopumilus ureiphilus]
MKSLGIVLASVIVFFSGAFLLSAYSEESNSMMMQNGMGSMNMCQSMMNSIPQDVIIKTISSQVVSVDEESTVTLLVLDKETGEPMYNATVILHIEKGGPMEEMDNMNMMDMMGKMFEAENIGSGKYLIKVNVDEKGYHTMHTHGIPEGKSMMNNHMDIGIIAK